ncbi:MAG: zinc-binding dehydrogenase [Haliscomenobacter sp.]|nr:zinc-binding dehydrogenase [Haliscomenobacter sp.]
MKHTDTPPEFSKTAVFHQTGQPLEIIQLPVPSPGPGELLIRIECTTLCRSDLNTYCGKRIEPSPTILGHEIVGRIVRLGAQAPREDLRGAALGLNDRITWAIYASDPDSPLAQKGIPQKGDRLFKYGHEKLTETNGLHGGLSEYIVLRPHTPIVKLHETIPLPVAAIINCAVATVAGALRLAGPVEGKQVLVCGAGMLGMIACAMSKSQGAAGVSALDVDPARLDAARDFGAGRTFVAAETLPQQIQDSFGNPAPFDLVIELSGSATAMENTLGLLGIGGIAVWVGATYPQPDLRLSGEKIIRNLLTIKGLHNYNQHDLLAAVEFMERHHQDFPFESMVHDAFTLEQANEAFEYGLNENPFRVGIRFDQHPNP